LPGQNGTTGATGATGVSCWDLNGNGAKDLPAEDVNGDLFVNVLDCTGAEGAQGVQGESGTTNLLSFSCSPAFVLVGFDEFGTPICLSFASFLIDTPPVWVPISDQILEEGTTLDIGVTAFDPNGGMVITVLGGSPAWATLLIDNADGTGTVRLAPPLSTPAGPHTVTVRVTADAVDVDTTFGVTVTTDTPPFWTPIPDQDVIEGTTTDVLVTAIDPEGGMVLSILGGSPVWATLLIDNADGTGTVRLAPPISTPAGPHTVTVRVSSDGTDVDTTFDVDVLGSIDPDLLDFSLVGLASLESDRLRAVPASFNVVGGGWYTPAGSEKHDVGSGFDVTFSFEISPGTAIAADGLAFVIQNESVAALGDPSSAGYVGITESVAVEFDVFLNGPVGDLTDRHIAVMSKGSAPNSQNHSAAGLAYVDTSIDFADGGVHTARIEYISGTTTMNVYLDDLVIPALSLSIDLASTITLDSGTAWVGLTAATGGLFSNHDILSWDYS
jgi:hypothetical protein